MNLTLHLTDGCNLACSYCTQKHGSAVMTEEVLHAACRLAFSEGTHAGFCFFGGEPLLCEDLIFETMDFCRSLAAETGKPVCYRMTTNGTLLSERLLARAAAEHMEIALSFDGLMQDICRRFRNGAGSFAETEAAAMRLLAALPDSTVMMTVAPQAADQFAASVRYLYALGFRSIHAVPAYGKQVCRDDAARETLRIQMQKAAAFFSECLLAGAPFYFSPVESKIRGLLTGSSPNERCHLGFTQMPVTPDGRIYACNQFIGDDAYCLGNVFDGIDRKQRTALAIRYAPPARCRGCSLKSRCLHSCGCLNRMETGDAAQVSDFQCSFEKMLICLADETAAHLIEADKPRFDRYFRQNGRNSG